MDTFILNSVRDSVMIFEIYKGDMLLLCLARLKNVMMLEHRLTDQVDCVTVWEHLYCCMLVLHVGSCLHLFRSCLACLPMMHGTVHLYYYKNAIHTR